MTFEEAWRPADTTVRGTLSKRGRLRTLHVSGRPADQLLPQLLATAGDDAPALEPFTRTLPAERPPAQKDLPC